MLDQDCIINVQQYLLDKATEMLKEASFGLSIVMIDVAGVQVATPQGVRPGWGIVYMAKGLLIGPENYNMQVTVVDTPFVKDEVLKKALSDGCDSLRLERSKQGNGKGLIR